MKRSIFLAVIMLIFAASLFSFGGVRYEVNITCWLDSNQNGVPDEGEPGIPGVLYRLETKAGDSLIAKHVTNDQGKVLFKVFLWDGTFHLFVDTSTLPEDYEITTGELEYFFTEMRLLTEQPNNKTQEQQVSLNKELHGNYLNYSLGIYSRSYEPEGDPVITPPEPVPGNTLVFLEGSSTFKQGQKPGLWGWDNTVDGDTSNLDTDAALFPYTPDVNPWAMYKFADDGMYKFNYVTMIRGIRNLFITQQLAVPHQFEILVSTTGLEPEDFTSAGTFTFDYFSNPAQETWFKFEAGFVTAKYIKLVVLGGRPYGGVAKSMAGQLYMTIAEFNVQTGDKQGAIPAVEKQNVVLSGFELMSNYPNPFNPQTTISYNLPSNELVELTIYDINGRVVERLVNEYQTRGTYTVKWDASSQASGAYFYKLSAGEFSAVKQMILLR